MIDFENQIERLLHAQNDEDSHVEERHDVFHPSQLAHCKRQCTISKYGLEEHDTETLGVFHVGSMIHEWLEDEFEERLAGVEFEKELQKRYDGRPVPVTVTGRCDAYDSVENVVYDFKTRNGWYKFDPPNDRHVDQLMLYMDMVGADAAQVVYINKANLEVKTWPEDGPFEFDATRHSRLMDKARHIASELKGSREDIETVDDVPFEPCGCWLCNSEGE